MSRLHDLGPVTDLPDPGSRAFTVDGIDGFLVRRGDLVRAYVDKCPHIGAPLAWSPDTYLDAEGELIQCAMHGALFLPDTGACVHGPCAGQGLTPVPMHIADGRVLLHLDELPEID